MNNKDLMLLMILDIIEFVLAVIGIVGFTFMFVALQTDTKYLFLVCDLYVIYVFIKNWNSIDKYFNEMKLEKTSQ